MTRLKRFLITAVSSVIGIPLLLIIIAPIAMSLLGPSPKSVSPEEMPDHFPVLGFWRDSAGPHCRAFLHRELKRHSDELPTLSFSVPSNDLAICS